MHWKFHAGEELERLVVVFNPDLAIASIKLGNKVITYVKLKLYQPSTTFQAMIWHLFILAIDMNEHGLSNKACCDHLIKVKCYILAVHFVRWDEAFKGL